MSEAQERNPGEAVAEIFTSAGWTAGTKDGWNGQFVWQAGNVVGGTDPYGTPRVAGLTAPDGERPDVVTAAAWLVEHAKQFAPDISTQTTLELPLAQEPEAVETPQDESNGETGEEVPSEEIAGSVGRDGDQRSEHSSVGVSFEGRVLSDEPEVEGVLERVSPLDADFTVEDLGGEDDPDLPSLEGADLTPEPSDYFTQSPPEAPQDRFIGLDDLDRRRSLRIGDVIRYANGLMPRWLPEDDARLATLRNFAMGVSEKRWDDNPANQAELNALETTIRRINEIKNARDDKVAFLEGASREEVEDFSVEANWP